jgi:hypothetical protein
MEDAMEILWFFIGIFVGGSIGTLLMAAACLAARSDHLRQEKTWPGAYERIIMEGERKIATP